jgi:hypothetical protein
MWYGMVWFDMVDILSYDMLYQRRNFPLLQICPSPEFVAPANLDSKDFDKRKREVTDDEVSRGTGTAIKFCQL